VCDSVDTSDEAILTNALAEAGRSEPLRRALFDALRKAEATAAHPTRFRQDVRWPLMLALLRDAKTHRIVLNNGLLFDVSPVSRIEQAALLSLENHPDHIWEPQTTKLLVTLAEGASHVLVGGAYIGDHVLPLARVLARKKPAGVVHAFEPMAETFRRLQHNLALNGITNVTCHQLGLWDHSDAALRVDGPAALASSSTGTDAEADSAATIRSIAIDDYVSSHRLDTVGLIMLDTEGGEERGLHGAAKLLSQPGTRAPHVVFEIHRTYVDWSDGLEKTPIVRYLTEKGYRVFAIRDIHGNHPMMDRAIEVIPIDRVYLEGPPHGFNVLATKDQTLIGRLGLSVVERVSPKLLPDKDPALHHPLDDRPWGNRAVVGGEQ
jgi:FkbM family methyltransferase